MSEYKVQLKDPKGNILNPVTTIENVEGLQELIPSEASSTNLLADKKYVDDSIPTVNIVNMTETTVSIEPNKFYVWGEVGSLTITLTTPTDESVYNEYMFQFTSGSTATTLSLPDTLTWYLDKNTISANKTYQISIVNNLAILGEF